MASLPPSFLASVTFSLASAASFLAPSSSSLESGAFPPPLLSRHLGVSGTGDAEYKLPIKTTWERGKGGRKQKKGEEKEQWMAASQNRPCCKFKKKDLLLVDWKKYLVFFPLPDLGKRGGMNLQI